MQFYYDDGSVTAIENVTNANNGNFVVNDWDTDSAGKGEFDLIAQDNSSSNSSVTVSKDIDGPSVSSESPDGTTSETSPTVSYSASDSLSSVDNDSYYIGVYDDDDNLVEEDNSSSIDVSGLNEEQYTVEYEVKDTQGNLNDGSWTFTVDTTADFTLGLSSSDFSPEPGTIEMDDDQEVDITLEDLNEDGEARCLDGDDEVDAADVESGEDVEFTCEFDQDEYGGSTVNVEVEVCDEVDNCKTSEDSYEFKFDQFSPTVSDLETESGAISFNDQFDVTFEVSDDVSGVENVEYYFNDFVDYGEGTDVGYEDGTSVYTVNPSSLETGQHTVKFRAEDGAGRWSDVQELEFSYYPELSPSVSLDVPENMNVTSGSSEDLNVEVTNDGEIFVASITVDVSGGFFSASQDIENLKPGDSANPVFSVEPTEENIGEHQVTVSTSEGGEESFSLLVEANQEQRQEIDSTVDEYSQKLEDLEQNITALKSSGLSEERNSRLDANFSDFKESIEEAESAVEAGDYYLAEEALSSIQQQYNSAEQTYSQVKKEEERAQNRQTILMVLLGVVVVASSGIGYIAYSDRYDLDIEAIEEKLHEFETDIDLGSGDGSMLGRLSEKIDELLDTGAEAEDYSWEGFKQE